MTTLWIFFEESWNKRMGVDGISYGELKRRMQVAVDLTDYYAPSITGLVNPKFDLMQFFNHSRLVDNFFVNAWTTEQKMQLIDECHDVLIIHSNTAIADEFQKRLTRFRASFIKLTSWQQADDVVEEGKKSSARLVLFSGGPAAKFIGPLLAVDGKIAIDVGNAMDFWIPPR